MTVYRNLKTKLEQRLGRPVVTMADCECLASEINNHVDTKDGNRVVGISRHTIARMFGITEQQRSLRPGTMDVIAAYLDYDSAEELGKATGCDCMSNYCPVDRLDMENLNPGTLIHLSYSPDRDLTMTYLGDSHFLVNESLNSGLHKGDEVVIPLLEQGKELTATSVMRDGTDLGAYRSAKAGGISILEIV